MKELSIKEKAIAYDKAYKTAENIHRFSSDPAEIKRMEQIFPELKVESEDERIRKALIRFHKSTIDIDGIKGADVIAWLEKQAEHANFCNKIQIGDKVTRNRDGVLVNLSQLNRVAKPAEKRGKNNMGISEATKQKLENNLNNALAIETGESWNEFLEKQGEQKKSYDTCNSSMINNKKFPYGEKRDFGYFKENLVDKDSSEEQHEKESLSEIENRIINFAMQFHDNRMKPEAEWEDELKMLRDNIKIDPWSEEDEVKINRIVACLENLNVADNDILLKDVDWLKSLKGKIQPQPKWSEDDIVAIDCAVDVLNKDLPTLAASIKRLKSLIPQNRWIPSDEQMTALDDAIAICSERDYETECRLDNLRKDLKKLKE